MTLHLLTLDFRHAPLALRERVAFAKRAIPGALETLRQARATEAAILSTCNRVELYTAFSAESDETEINATLLSFLSDWHRVPKSNLESHCCYLTDQEVAHHLIRVACGLESLVPGEMQILGQVKQAAQLAREVGTFGLHLNMAFTAAIRAGRRARNETAIARRPVSISHAAVRLIQEDLGHDLGGRHVLLIGSGKMGEVAAQQLHKAGASLVIVANRTLERACELAQRWDGTALSLAEIPDALSEVDAVISATGAPHYILHPHHIGQAMEARAGRELLLIDLAVPRDIDPRVHEFEGVVLRDVDSLQKVVARNLALRNEEREQVEAIAEDALDDFLTEQAVRSVVPTIVSLRRSAEKIRQAELEKALGRLSHLGKEERAVVEALSRVLMNKFLHEPTVRLREKAITEEGQQFQQTVEELFALKEKPA